LQEGEWEIITYASVERGVAVLGLADKFNSSGAVSAKRWSHDGSLAVTLRDGGKFLAWSERAPSELLVNGKPLAFSHDALTGQLAAELPVGGKHELLIKW